MGDLGSLGSDSEDLLVTSMNGHHLENCLGASLFIRKEVDLGTQANGGFSFQCYSSPDNRDCFDDETPLLIHTKQGFGGFGGYQEPFVIGPSFYGQGDIDVSGGGILKFEPTINGFGPNSVSSAKHCQDFGECLGDKNCDAVSTDKYRISAECTEEKSGEGKVCDSTSTEKVGTCVDCPNERAREDNEFNVTSAEKYGSPNECRDRHVNNAESVREYNEFKDTSAEKYESPKGCPDCQVGYAENVHGSLKKCPDCQAGNAESVDEIEVQGECTYGIVGDCLIERAREDNIYDEKSAKKYDIPKDCPNYQIGNAGSVRDVEVQKQCTNEIARECLPCNAESHLSDPAETRKDLDTAHGVAGEMDAAALETRKDLDMVYSGAGEMDTAASETEREATVHQVSTMEQHASSEVCIKPTGRKTSRQKKPTSSRKRVSRNFFKKAGDFVPSTGGGADLLISNNSEGPSVSTFLQCDLTDRPVYSSCVAPNTKQASLGINGIDAKLQVASKINDSDTVLSSNNNIVDKITGRITRSRANGKSCMKTLVDDSLSDESNAIFTKKMTGKRSVLCKTPRSKVWGGLENLNEGLEKTGIASKSELSYIDTEFGKGNIEAEIIQNRRVTKRESDVRRQKPGKFLEDQHSEQVKAPLFSSNRNCTKDKNHKLGRDGLQGQGFVLELEGSKEDILNVHGREVLYFNGDLCAGGEIVRQNNIEEEHKFLEIQRDGYPTDQSQCYLPLEVPKSPRNVDEESTPHGLPSELDKTNVEADVLQRGQCPSDVIQSNQCFADQSKCFLPHDVPKVLKNVEEEIEAHGNMGEPCKANIEADVFQNYRGRRRGSGLKRKQPGKIHDNGKTQQAKVPVYASSRNCRKRKNDKQGKGFLQHQSFVMESRTSEEHILNVQRCDFLCSSGDLHSGGGSVRQENIEEEHECRETEKGHCTTAQSYCYLPLEVPKSPGRVEEKNTAHGHSSELGGKNIEDEVVHNQRSRKRGITVKRRQTGKIWNNFQLEQVKFPVTSSSRDCSKIKNGRLENGVLWDKDSAAETGRSEEHGSSLQGCGLMCSSGELHSGGGIVRQETIEGEHEFLKIERDQCHSNRLKCQLPREFAKSPGKLEDKNATHGHSSEETICTFMNETKSHVSSTIKMGVSQECSKENTNHIFGVLHEKDNNASHKKQVAIPVQEMSGISVDNSIKRLEEGRSNIHAAVGTVLKMEKSGVRVGLELTDAQDIPVSSRKLCNQKYSLYERELLDVKEGSHELNIVISKFEQKPETRTCDTEIGKTDMCLKWFAESGMRMDGIDPYRTEHGDIELHDMVSATSLANTTETVAWQDSGKKKGKAKEKFKGESELSGTGLGVEKVPVGSSNVSENQNAARKLTKIRYKKTVVRDKVQGKKSNLKNRKNLLYADGNEHVVVGEALLSKEVEGKASCEPQETSNAVEMDTLVREEPIANAKLENTHSHGKCQARKNLKNARGGNRKMESMGGTVICERKRKVSRQTNNTSDKKLSRGKNKQVQNELQSFTKNNAKPGKGVSSSLIENELSNHETTAQGKAVIVDLSGIKGQSDSCTDAASSLKIEDASTNGQNENREKNGLSINQGSAEENVSESKILEKQGMVECNSEVVGEDVSSVISEGEANKIVTMVKHDENVERYCGSPRVGWVSCDDCQKWRRIPVELADAIGETNCKWTCQDNPNKDFADCCIPQEKSNAEINAELNISDVSCEEGYYNGEMLISKDIASMQAQDSHQAFWIHTKRNLFLHRGRKTQAIDEIMVCHCKLPEDGSYGCGDDCLNRMLNIECVKGTCPCADLCSNQQFQKRLYTDVGLLRCGKKGFGLQVLQEVQKGLFIIEYVGEVLDMQTYDSRQKEYASRGQKHFYFMTLDTNEVIDACVKGNLGRFINHSCDPNCRTEKWMVNGEVCIGLFAIRDIMKGEELTFDYNYVRFFGAAAKKCECGSAECKGFIGGDQSTPTVVVPSEPDENYPVPVMLHEESENDSSQENNVRTPKGHSSCIDVSQEHSLQFTGTKDQCSLAQNLKPVEVSRNCGTHRSIGIPAIGNTPNLKKSTVQTNLGRFEGVEEKINELLDNEGGISKRKDAAKHYLQLLLVTAASGNTSNGEAFHSTRDLSMVLDALLKTRSRTVLIDIMNKNGLQMLHNMLKQNRDNYNKTPIIRKLLKVLEFLATKDVLTFDHINSGPLCRGRESFKASIYALTGHNDWQVQQIARSFRDNWILHPMKMFKSRDRSVSNEPGLTVSDHPNNRCKFSAKRQKNLVLREADAIDCTSHTPQEPESVARSPCTWFEKHEGSHGSQDNLSSNDGAKKLSEDHVFEGHMGGARPRKRKSRWDQPTEPVIHQSFAQTALESGDTKIMHQKGSDSVILPSDRDNTLGMKQDSVTYGCKCSSEEKTVNTADKNIPYTDSSVHSAPASHPLSEQITMLKGSDTIVKEKFSLESTMQQSMRLSGHVHLCMGSSHTPSCSTDVACVQPYIMGAPQGKTVLGYAVGKPHGSVLPHLPLSYGIPLSLLEQLGRAPSAKVDSVDHPLSPPRLHCEPNRNSMAATMQPNMAYRPFVGQPMVGGFAQNPHHQLRPSNIPLLIQSAHPVQSGRRLPLEMHRRDLLGQCMSATSNYVEPEPPVPGLSPRGSSENLHNINRPVRGRNKTAYGQTLKPSKRHWKTHKSSFRTFSKFNGYPDKRNKDCFHPRKPFKSTWKGRFSSNFHNCQNLQYLPNGNILDLEKEQPKLENVNSANFSKGVSKNFPTFN